MKYRYIIVLVILSFCFGAGLGRYKLNKSAENAVNQVAQLQALMKSNMTEFDKTRAALEMEKTIEAIGYLIEIEDPYEDQSYLGEQYLHMVKRDLNRLKEIDMNEIDDSSKKRINSLIEKAEKLISDIEFKYL